MKNVKTQTVEREINKQQPHKNKCREYYRKRGNYKNVGIGVNMSNFKQDQSYDFFESFDNGKKDVIKKDVNQINKDNIDVRVNMFSLDDTNYWSCNQQDQQTNYWKDETPANKKHQDHKKQDTSRMTVAKRKEKRRTNNNNNNNNNRKRGQPENNNSQVSVKYLSGQSVKFQKSSQISDVQISLINDTLLGSSSYQENQPQGYKDINYDPATMIKQQNKSTNQNKTKIKPASKNTNGIDINKRPSKMLIMPNQTEQFVSIDSQQQPTETKKPPPSPHPLKLPTNSPGLQNRSYHIPVILTKQVPFNQNLSFLTQIQQQRKFAKEKDRLTSQYKVKSSLVMHVSRKNVPIHVQWDDSGGSSFSQISTFRRRLC